jgi:hypothetical protein
MPEALSAFARKRLQQFADELLGGVITLRLHRGEPGADYQNNVVALETRVTRETFADEEGLTFYADRHGVYCVSVWSDGCPISLLVLDEVHQNITAVMKPGDTITITSFPCMRMHPGAS